MLTQNDAIIHEDFDREYGLADLLPQAWISEIAAPLAPIAAVAVADVSGRPYFGRIALPPDQLSALIRFAGQGNREVILFGADIGRAAACSLVHEMETVAVVLLQSRTQRARPCLAAMAACLAKALNRLINANYRGKMTYGLHARVVSDAYDELMAKAEALAKSEDKYRRLAENLEIEVQRKSAQIQKTQMMLMQQEKMAAVGQLSAGMAHEINNPIGFILSNLNTLKESFDAMAALIRDYETLQSARPGSSNDPTAWAQLGEGLSAIDRRRQALDIDFVLEDGLQLIEESLAGGRRIQAIVQNLRDFAHPSIESAESVDINACLDTTLAVMAQQIPEKVVIRRHYEPLPPVTCHLREINQAIYHILHNALQAVGSQGNIDLRTHARDRQVEITIRDSGPGIPEADLGRIFDPFFTTRDVGQGVGLGLHTAYLAVQKQGGTIDVDSGAGRETTFTIRLPLVPSCHSRQQLQTDDGR